MIFIVGTYEHARTVAQRNGLQEGRDWKHLSWYWTLAGEEAPNVVLLETYKQLREMPEILDEIYARSAVVWSERDLDNGKVPR
jgi:hypothetical protein